MTDTVLRSSGCTNRPTGCHDSAGFALRDIKETEIQQGIYCSVPAANTAFHRLQAVVDRLEADGVGINKAGL